MTRTTRILRSATLAILVILFVAGYWVIYHVFPYSPIVPRRYSQAEVIARLRARGSVDTLLAGAKPFSVMTGDSVRLSGLFLPAKGPTRGTVIFLHGISSYKETKLRQAQDLAREGFNCAVYDSRAHGESGGAYCTFGFYEKRDIPVIIDTLLRQFGPVGPFALHGSSLGAAVAVQALPLEPRILCAVVRAPFATLREVIYDYQVRLYHIPFRWVTDAALGESERIAHFVADSVSPERAASGALQPVLVIHGTADDEITIAHGRRVFSELRSPRKEFFELPGGDHGSLGRITPEEHDRRIVAFLRKNLDWPSAGAAAKRLRDAP